MLQLNRGAQSQGVDELPKASKNMGIWYSRGCTGKIGAQESVTVPLKPLCCRDRQPYGRVWERVWELGLGLGT